jgi:hypothetical protein
MPPLPMCTQSPLKHNEDAAQEGARLDAQSNLQDFQTQPVTSINAALQNAINQRVLKDAMQNALQNHQHIFQSPSNNAGFEATFAAAIAPTPIVPAICLASSQFGGGEHHTAFQLDVKPAASDLNRETGRISNASQIREQNSPTLPPLQLTGCHNTVAHQTNSGFWGRATEDCPHDPSMNQPESNLDQ